MELGRGGLAGDRDHRRAVQVGVGDAGHEVRRTRAERAHGDGGPTGQPAVDVGHERGALLVAGRDVADLRPRRQGVEDVHRLLAGHREDGVAALGDEALDEQVGGATAGRWGGHGRVIVSLDRRNGSLAVTGHRCRPARRRSIRRDRIVRWWRGRPLARRYAPCVRTCRSSRPSSSIGSSTRRSACSPRPAWRSAARRCAVASSRPGCRPAPTAACCSRATSSRPPSRPRRARSSCTTATGTRMPTSARIGSTSCPARRASSGWTTGPTRSAWRPRPTSSSTSGWAMAWSTSPTSRRRSRRTRTSRHRSLTRGACTCR